MDPIVATVDSYELTRLGDACYRGDLAEVKKLLDEGENDSQCIVDEIYVYDLVYAAVYFEKTDILKFLIDRTYDLNTIYNEDGLTALSLACKKSNLEIASLLLQGGADADGGGYPKSGYTTCPIIEAVTNHNVELVKLLLRHDVDLEISGVDNEGHSPMDIAIKNNDDQIIELLKNGARSFDALISNVPVSALPIGIAAEKLSSLEMDREHLNAMDELVPCDAANKYGLNGAFIFEDLKAGLVNRENTIAYSVLSASGEMIFARRLPPINDREFLIYRVIRTNDAQPDFPLWVLLMADQQGVVLSSAVIAGADCWENDHYVSALFRIDSDNVLTVKLYAEHGEDEEAKEGDENKSYAPDRLYETSMTKHKLSANGINKIL